MGILDDAIREHLDLKRKHGARDSEISEIEDEAFGSGDRPDPFAAGELFGGAAPSASATRPEQAAGPATPPPGDLELPPSEEPTALVEPQAPPPGPPAAPPEPSFPEPPGAAPPEPSFPEPPPEPTPPERHAAPEAPAESESLEELMVQEKESAPAPEADFAPPPPPPPPPEAEGGIRPSGEPATPTEPEQPAADAGAEPQPEASEIESIPEPPPPPPAASEGQRGRALGRADVPTQEHLPPPSETGEAAAPSEPEPVSDSGPQLYDFETDPGLVEEEGADLGTARPPAEESDDFEALGPVKEEAEEDLYLEEEEPHPEEPAGAARSGEVEIEEEEIFETEVRRDDTGEEEDDDLLSGSPEFLEQDTESEGLWFEKGPPQDFDFEEEEEEEEEEEN
jgi:hypothetical protein